MIVVILTASTMAAFAANSLLCRLALGGSLVDPVSFTVIRLVSGALALIPASLLFGKNKKENKARGSWTSAFALFSYAAAFSLSYISLNAGVGALILFGSVQATMIGAALLSGEKPGLLQWAGSVRSRSDRGAVDGPCGRILGNLLDTRAGCRGAGRHDRG
jgi:drug/metabolite transporter (DMT)-like permease